MSMVLVDNEYLNTGLTNIANKIREKSGTSERMDFPSGFVNAVDGIEVGVGGSTPSSGGNYQYKKMGEHTFATGETEFSLDSQLDPTSLEMLRAVCTFPSAPSANANIWIGFGTQGSVMQAGTLKDNAIGISDCFPKTADYENIGHGAVRSPSSYSSLTYVCYSRDVQATTKVIFNDIPEAWNGVKIELFTLNKVGV